MMKAEQVYELAVQAVKKIINQGGYINIVIDEVITSHDFGDSERRLFTKLVYGTVENKILLDYYLHDYITGKRLKPDLKNTLRVATYAIEFLNVANHFIVTTSVENVKKKDYKGSRLINGVLRQFVADERPELDKLPYKEFLSIKYSYPSYVVDMIVDQYPNQAEAIFKAFDAKEVKALRINSLKASQAEVLKALDQEHIKYELDRGALFIDQSMVEHPLFIDGKIVYQDTSSQQVAKVVDPKPGELILDACSAPGGKTAHMAALSNNMAHIVATDVHDHKLKLMEENFERLGVTCVTLTLEDARNLSKSYTNHAFDKILVDAPCSGLGVMGHKVDIKYQLDSEKINRLIALQAEILDKVEPLLKDGGSLVYSTCTINKDENEQQMQAFVKRHPQYVMTYEESLIPDEHQDGFYICKLTKMEERL